MAPPSQQPAGRPLAELRVPDVSETSQQLWQEMSLQAAIVCQPASLPATAPAPEPAGTFALWLQFPGMPNLRQLLRTCYLCQQCARSAHHISCHSVSIWYGSHRGGICQGALAVCEIHVCGLPQGLENVPFPPYGELSLLCVGPPASHQTVRVNNNWTCSDDRLPDRSCPYLYEGLQGKADLSPEVTSKRPGMA
ncbi:hypothetical protein Q8A73_001179 [Channa argus]|nr:hypothetical protein Q8A73_001179 [Channa argus]